MTTNNKEQPSPVPGTFSKGVCRGALRGHAMTTNRKEQTRNFSKGVYPGAMTLRGHAMTTNNKEQTTPCIPTLIPADPGPRNLLNLSCWHGLGLQYIHLTPQHSEVPLVRELLAQQLCRRPIPGCHHQSELKPGTWMVVNGCLTTWGMLQ